MPKQLISIISLAIMAFFIGSSQAQSLDTLARCPSEAIDFHNSDNVLEACQAFGEDDNNLLVIQRNKDFGIKVSIYEFQDEGYDFVNPIMEEVGLGLSMSNFNLGRFHLEDINKDGSYELLLRARNHGHEFFYMFTLNLKSKQFVDIGGERRYDNGELLPGHQISLAPNSLVFYENKRLMVRTPGEQKKIYRFKKGRFVERRPTSSVDLINLELN